MCDSILDIRKRHAFCRITFKNTISNQKFLATIQPPNSSRRTFGWLHNLQLQITKRDSSIKIIALINISIYKLFLLIFRMNSEIWKF